MNFLKPGVIAGAFMFAAIGFSASATASPLGGASRDLASVAGETNLLIEVQGGWKKKSGGSKNGTMSSGGGNRSGGHRGGGHGVRNAAAVGAGVALIGGLIAADQARKSSDEDRYYDGRRRCEFGSYINRYGERRCRR
jgi:hypothetical protein